MMGIEDEDCAGIEDDYKNPEVNGSEQDFENTLCKEIDYLLDKIAKKASHTLH